MTTNEKVPSNDFETAIQRELDEVLSIEDEARRVARMRREAEQEAVALGENLAQFVVDRGHDPSRARTIADLALRKAEEYFVGQDPGRRTKPPEAEQCLNYILAQLILKHTGKSRFYSPSTPEMVTHVRNSLRLKELINLGISQRQAALSR
jgi:hypothetical protein